jgi:indolepyruvate ferredoxin oxidoreductase
LNHDNHALALQIANVPERIRGYGQVKEKHLERANHEREALLETWRQPLMLSPAAAE